MVRLLFVCGSARKASTAYAVEQAKKFAEEIEDVQVDILYLQGKKIAPCMGCNACVKKNIPHCVVYHDDMDEWNTKLWEYDGLLLATPVYEMGITPQMSGFLSRYRAEYLIQKDDPNCRLYMPGAALAVGGTRNGGQESAINCLIGWFHTQGMPVVNGGLGVYGGACVWSQDRMAEGAAEDEKGMSNVKAVAQRLALVAKALKAGKPTT